MPYLPDEQELRIAVVHTEPCVAFVGDDDAPGGVCVACGWLIDEHEDLFAFLARETPAAA